MLLAIPIGVVAGLGAVAFYGLWLETTQFFLVGVVGISYPIGGTPSTGIVTWPSEFPRILLLPLVMILGGLVVGVIARFGAPEVSGDGTEPAITAFHSGDGNVRARVPILALISSAVTLGTGGAGGREGPAAQIGGGFGAWWSSALDLSARDRRVALATGMAAGVGAIFRAPLGGAVYAAEILYLQDFEPDVFFPAIIASVVSYSLFSLVYGFGALFALPASGVNWTVGQLPLYILLGAICAASGIGFVVLLRYAQKGFARTSLTPPLRVALGMGLAGTLAVGAYFLLPWGDHFAALASINVGYGFVQAAMLGQIGLTDLLPIGFAALAVTIVLRAVTTGLTVGSGGATGTFGTCVVIGGLIGALIGASFHQIAPGLVSVAAISAFAVVGMMAFFGGVSKAPLAVLIMVVEMTGSFSLLVPAMLAIAIAYLGTGSYHLFDSQVASRLDSPAHREEYLRRLLRPSEPPGPGAPP